MQGNEIINVFPDSIADELGLVKGDKVISINGKKLSDIIDVSFAFADEEIELLIEHADGSQEIYEFDKDYDEELGVEFSSAVFNGIRSCANNCYFCFVAQIAPHMRDTLHIKDDDYRLSFLYGNFITLTNMGPRDFKRLHDLHLSPIYVSIHATNPVLRAEMMQNKRAALLEEQLDELDRLGIDYHTQVVLCPHLNDGDELERTISDIAKRRPHALSMAIVPVGLTKFRDKNKCYPLETFDKEGALRTIKQVEAWQKRFRKAEGFSFLYLSDEFYSLAEYPVPPTEVYDGFPQLSNGIGLTRSFIDSWQEAKALFPPDKFKYEHPLHLTIICGMSPRYTLQTLIDTINIPNLHIKLLPVKNDYFGNTVTVSGLLTGKDILSALQVENTNICDGVIIPGVALRTGEDIFLDDMSLGELVKASRLQIKVADNGAGLYKLLTTWYDISDVRDYNSYTWQSNAAYTK